MPRPHSEEGYIYYKEPRDNRIGRHVLEIYEYDKDTGARVGKMRKVFYASKIKAGEVARSLYEKLKGKPSKKRGKPLQDAPETLVDYVDLFVARREAGHEGNAQQHSIAQVSSRFQNHFKPFFQRYRLDEITVDHIHLYKACLVDKGLADKTIGYLLMEAKEFFSYAVECGWMERTPFDSTFKMPKVVNTKRRRPLDIAVLRDMAMRTWANPVNEGVYLVSLATGDRVSENRALLKTSFEEYYGHPECEDCVVVHIDYNLTNKNARKAPKNGRSRVAVIPRWYYEYIKPVFDLSKSDLCFSNTQGRKPISIDKNLKNFRAEYAKVTGLSPDDVEKANIDFHSVRTTVNTLLTGELNDDLRRAMLGWSSENVGLDHYFSIQPVHYQQILDAQNSRIFSPEMREYFETHSIFG